MNAAVGSQSGSFNVVSAPQGSIQRLYSDSHSIGGLNVSQAINTLVEKVAYLEGVLAPLQSFPAGTLLSWDGSTLSPVETETAEAEETEETKEGTTSI